MCAMSEHRERVPQENIIGLFTAKFKILLFKEQQQQQKKPLICSIVNFHGVNTLPWLISSHQCDMTDWWRWEGIPYMHTIAYDPDFQNRDMIHKNTLEI